MKFLTWLLDRLDEASTWRGIIVALTGLGVSLSPELQNHIISAGLALAGILGIVTKDKSDETPTV